MVNEAVELHGGGDRKGRGRKASQRAGAAPEHNSDRRQQRERDVEDVEAGQPSADRNRDGEQLDQDGVGLVYLQVCVRAREAVMPMQ